MIGKPLLPLMLALSLAACGTEQGRTALVGTALSGLIPGRDAAPAGPTAEQIKARVTPAVRARFGNVPLKVATLEEQGLSSILFRRAVNGGVETYFTPDGTSVALQEGLLVATRGLGYDLMSADVGAVREGLLTGRQSVRVHRYLDGEDRLFIRSFVCDYAGGREVRETCYSEDLKITNSYQLDGAGRVISSRQWIGPEQGFITIQEVP